MKFTTTLNNLGQRHSCPVSDIRIVKLTPAQVHTIKLALVTTEGISDKAVFELLGVLNKASMES